MDARSSRKRSQSPALPPPEGDPNPPRDEAAVLENGSAHEILDRLVDGDPLGVWDACEDRLQRRCLLLDTRRLAQQTMARIAYAATSYARTDALEAWVVARVDEAIEDLLARDLDEERRGIPPVEPWDERYAFVAQVLGVQVGLARRVCITLNGLDDDVRHAFFHIVARDQSIGRYVAEGHGPPDRVRELLGLAFHQISRSAPSELEEADVPGDVERGADLLDEEPDAP